MLRRIVNAILISAFLCGPVVAAENVKGVTAPPAAANTQKATETNSAVIEHGLSTATVTVPASSEPRTFEIPIKPLMDALLPYIVSALGGIIVVIGGLVTAWLKQKWNIDIDQSQRNAWQQSAQNAAGALLARGAVLVEESGKITVKNADMAAAVNRVMDRVPDAIKHFDLSPTDVQNLIVAKIPQVMSGSISPTAAPAPDAAGAAVAAAKP